MSTKFCKLLKEALEDEHKAPQMYAKLLAETPEEITRMRGRQWFDPHTDISSIQFDERRHAETLQKIERKYCLRRRK